MTSHIGWLREKGMIVNASKTEMVFFKEKEDLLINIEGKEVRSRSEMNVLGITFDSELSWLPQVRRAMSNCQRMKPALRCLKKRLNAKELLQVITSHFYPRLYYGSEVWFHCVNKCTREKITPLHLYPLRLAVGDCKKLLSNKKVLNITNRASPLQFNDYKVAKTLISIINSTCPFVIFHELLAHAVIERRRQNKPWFLDMSRTRIGRQSFENRVNTISKTLSFDWHEIDRTKDATRKLLKDVFFSA